MCSLVFDQTVLPVIRKFANKTRHFTLIQTFDRLADPTKGCTEATRATVPISPLQYSGFQISDSERIKAYSTCWLDRDNGRQKIITSYVHACKDAAFLSSKLLPRNFSHFVIGGHSGIFSAYSVDDFGTISFSSDVDYSCYHAEADTVVFYALNG